MNLFGPQTMSVASATNIMYDKNRYQKVPGEGTRFSHPASTYLPKTRITTYLIVMIRIQAGHKHCFSFHDLLQQYFQLLWSLLQQQHFHRWHHNHLTTNIILPNARYPAIPLIVGVPFLACIYEILWLWFFRFVFWPYRRKLWFWPTIKLSEWYVFNLSFFERCHYLWGLVWVGRVLLYSNDDPI